MAWFSQLTAPSLLQGPTYGQRAGSFDFNPHVYRGLTRKAVFGGTGRPERSGRLAQGSVRGEQELAASSLEAGSPPWKTLANRPKWRHGLAR